ncbi:MAG TPA: tetratricopeptide repeat protein [Thermoanaerobaculia bacterium]|nr:tetratricopeptide repeat protein [Thermoanaerobaculia bacterium]
MRRPAARRALLAACAALAAGCAGPSAPDPAELPRPSPALHHLEPTLRAAVVAAQERVALLADDPEADPAEVGEAFGALGQLYHAYDLSEAARAAYRNAATLRPDDFRWPYLEAVSAQHNGDFATAEELYGRALEIDPESVPAWVRLGNVHLEQNRHEEAKANYRKALAIDPASAAAVYGMAQAEAAAGDLEASLGHYRRALELAPYATRIHYPLAQLYRRLGRADEAARHLELSGRRPVDLDDPLYRSVADLQVLTSFRVVRDLAAQPGDVTPEELLGVTLTQLGGVDGTIPQLERVVRAREADSEVSPGEVARLHYVLGALLVYDDRDEEAIGHFGRAVELEPELTDAALKLGDALARTGRLEAALAEYSRVLERSPGHPAARLKRATLLINLGRIAEGRRELQSLVAAEPTDPVLLARLAESYELGGDPRTAEESFRRGLAAGLSDGDRARLHRSFGDFWNRRSRTEAAVEQYQAAADLDPGFVAVRLELGHAFGRLERYEEAAAAYRQVIRLEPQNEDARQGEAAALILAGSYGEARRRLEEGVATVRDEPTLTHLLARLLAAAPNDAVRDGQRALELAEAAFALAPSPLAAETVAMAYAEAGRFDEAARWQTRAMENGADGRTSAMRRRAYAEGRPWRVGSPQELLVPRGPPRAAVPS